MFESETEETPENRARHLNEASSRRDAEAKIDLIREAVGKLKEEFNG